MKKVAFSALTLGFAISTFAQTEDNSKLKFGFNMGLNYSRLQTQKSFLTNAESTHTSNNLGGRMGIVVDYNMAKHFSFSPKAEMSFNGGEISIIKMGDQVKTYAVLPVTIELSPHFNYKAKAGKSTPYILLGPCFKIPLIDKKAATPQMTHSSDVAIDFGIGFDEILPSFNFAPELRYSYGLMNLSSVDAISKLHFHSISVLFHFKG